MRSRPQALADTTDGLTGSEIGHILASLKMADPDPAMTKWKRLHNSFIKRQNHSRNRQAILFTCVRLLDSYLTE
jgi:hypothetical protein